MATNLADEIAAKAAALPIEKQHNILQIVESLIESTAQESASHSPRHQLMGSLEHLNIKLAGNDVQEARGEMWGNY